MARRGSIGASGAGQLLAIVAFFLVLVGQIGCGSLVIPDDAGGLSATAMIRAASVTCEGGTQATPRDPARHHHHHHEAGGGALCPLSVALSASAFILVPAAVFARVRVTVVPRAGRRPPARGPPPAETRAGMPRGPPLPV